MLRSPLIHGIHSAHWYPLFSHSDFGKVEMMSVTWLQSRLGGWAMRSFSHRGHAHTGSVRPAVNVNQPLAGSNVAHGKAVLAAPTSSSR